MYRIQAEVNQSQNNEQNNILTKPTIHNFSVTDNAGDFTGQFPPTASHRVSSDYNVAFLRRSGTLQFRTTLQTVEVNISIVACTSDRFQVKRQR